LLPIPLSTALAVGLVLVCDLAAEFPRQRLLTLLPILLVGAHCGSGCGGFRVGAIGGNFLLAARELCALLRRLRFMCLAAKDAFDGTGNATRHAVDNLHRSFGCAACGVWPFRRSVRSSTIGLRCRRQRYHRSFI
jgi:hypothetical protein